jgi:hypothetical protein
MPEQAKAIFLLVRETERRTWKLIAHAGSNGELRTPPLCERGALFELRAFDLFLLFRAFVFGNQVEAVYSDILATISEWSTAEFADLASEDRLTEVLDARIEQYREIDRQAAEAKDPGGELAGWGRRLCRLMAYTTVDRPPEPSPPIIVGDFFQLFMLESVATSSVQHMLVPYIHLPVLGASRREPNLAQLSGDQVEALLADVIHQLREKRNR